MAGKLQRLSNALRTGIAVAMLTVTTYAAAQGLRGDHPDTYVVVRGDTLWDIAGRFLQKPWLWPEIWQANPQIANPHLIYPGDVISLAYLNRVGVTPGPRTEAAPINAVPLSEVEPFLKDLRVVDSFDHMPYVVGLEEDRLRGSRGQVVYVRGLAGSTPGTRYAVLRHLRQGRARRHRPPQRRFRQVLGQRGHARQGPGSAGLRADARDRRHPDPRRSGRHRGQHPAAGRGGPRGPRR